MNYKLTCVDCGTHLYRYNDFWYLVELAISNHKLLLNSHIKYTHIYLFQKLIYVQLKQLKQTCNSNVLSMCIYNFIFSFSVYIPLMCPCLLLLGTPEQGHTQYVAPAILHQYEHMPVSKLDITTLFSRCLTSPEERCIQVFVNS